MAKQALEHHRRLCIHAYVLERVKEIFLPAICVIEISGRVDDTGIVRSLQAR